MIKFTHKKFKSFLSQFEKFGFEIHENFKILDSYAEFYRCGDMTIQICFKGFFDEIKQVFQIERFEVHKFFDSEFKAYDNRTFETCSTVELMEIIRREMKDSGELFEPCE